jgi:hypothetical protein
LGHPDVVNDGFNNLRAAYFQESEARSETALTEAALFSSGKEDIVLVPNTI